MENKKEEHQKHAHSQHHANKKNKFDIFLIAAVALGIILIINIFLTFGISQNLKKSIEAAKEAAKPAKIQLTLIKNSNCLGCFDASAFVDYVKSQKVELLSEKSIEFNSNEAKEMISKYNIEKIPSVLVSGELNKLALEGFDKKEDAFVLSQINPPYTDAKSGKVKGIVSLKLIKDDSCGKCNGMESLISQINLAGIAISAQKNVSISSEEGKSLISKYKIDFAPAVILSQDAEEYAIIQQAWPQIGTKEKDAYVLRTVYPPFTNLTTGELKGLVDVVYVADSGCADCYDVSIHKSILTSPQSFAMAFGNEKTIDISSAEGKELISKYNLIQAPTVILSAEAGVYPSSAGLAQFFSIEKDGFYVFRQAQVVGNYKDLAANKIISQQEQSA